MGAASPKGNDFPGPIKAVAYPGGMGANHPKYQTTALSWELIIDISLFEHS
jgi:hypothetical protein